VPNSEFTIPAHLKQMVGRLTETEGEILGEVGVSLKQAQDFGRRWEQEALPALVADVERIMTEGEGRRSDG
jgi:hypothetical protein